MSFTAYMDREYAATRMKVVATCDNCGTDHEDPIITVPCLEPGCLTGLCFGCEGSYCKVHNDDQ